MSQILNLRPYQIDAVERLRDGFRNGHRSQMLVAPTGAGKTAIAAHLMDAARRKGTRIAFVVDRVSLVDQTSAVLDLYGIDHGIVQAGHWRRRGYEPIQICSAQTIEARGFFPDLKMLVVDEAHAVRKATASLIRARTDMTVIGLTATPFTKGLGQLYSNLVNVATTNQLIADGFLVPVHTYAAVAPDMAGAKVIAGEWSDSDIEKRGLAIVGDIVAEWVDKTANHFGGPVKTIVFAATVEHGAELCRQFNAAGFRFEQISYRDGNEQRRRELIEEYRRPDSGIVGLVSCEVFSKGFDVPDVLCGISARPYRRSLSSHVQQLGRVMRPAPGKTFALWLDHSGNALRFHDDTAELFANGVQSLSDSELDSKVRKEPEAKALETIKCGSCGFVLPPRVEMCPACGHARKRLSLVEELPGEMILIGSRQAPAVGKHAYLARKDDIWRQLCQMARERKGGDSEAARRFAQAQYASIYGNPARRIFENTEPMPPTVELRGLVQHNLIRFSRSRAKVAA
jgi:superfamily II DNA or RNA helicase